MEKTVKFHFITTNVVIIYTNMLTYTMLTLDCKSSCVHLWMLKHVQGALFNQCILSSVLMALVYIHNTIT